MYNVIRPCMYFYLVPFTLFSVRVYSFIEPSSNYIKWCRSISSEHKFIRFYHGVYFYVVISCIHSFCTFFFHIKETLF